VARLALVRPALALALALCALAGCAAERWSYTKAGLTPGRLDQDLEACRRLARRPHWFALTRSARVDQEVLNQCMQRRGYTARRDE
jgi:hypothetical protein